MPSGVFRIIWTISRPKASIATDPACAKAPSKPASVARPGVVVVSAEPEEERAVRTVVLVCAETESRVTWRGHKSARDVAPMAARRVACAAARRSIAAGDQTALSEPDVRFESALRTQLEH